MIEVISKEAYVQADEKTRHQLTYDLLKGIYEKLDEHMVPCKERFKKLEDTKKRDNIIATGIGGTIVAILGYLKDVFWK